jgi:CBS domain-containing protein
LKSAQTRDYQVRDFMTRGVLTIEPEATMAKAIELMGGHEVGSLAVSGPDGLVGVLTERNVLHALARGKIPAGRTVRELMTKSTTQVPPSMGTLEAAKTMTDSRGRLLVVEGGQLAGIVTATDLVKVIWRVGALFDLGDVVSRKVVTAKMWSRLGAVVRQMDAKGVGSVVLTERRIPRAIFTERDLISRVQYLGVGLEEPVIRACTTPLITAELGIGGAEAASAMVSRRIRRLPLIKGGTLAGIVTARDIVQAYAYPYGSRGTDVAAQFRVKYGELCPICQCRIDESGLCGCGAGGG